MPVLTHPERLTWIEKHYDVICQLDELGVVVQLTASSVVGFIWKTCTVLVGANAR